MRKLKFLINYEWYRAATIFEMNPISDFDDSHDSVENILLLLLLLLL
jgi:hypothetical protein